MARAEPLDLDLDVDLDHFEVDLDPGHVERPLDLDLDVALPATDRLPSFGEIAIDVELPETVPTLAPEAYTAVAPDVVRAVAPAMVRAVPAERAVRNAAALFFVLLSVCAIAAGVIAAFLFP